MLQGPLSPYLSWLDWDVVLSFLAAAADDVDEETLEVDESFNETK